MVEMVAVVAILLILAGMASVTFVGQTDQSVFANEKTKMLDLLRQARTIARDRVECVSVNFVDTTAQMRTHAAVGGGCTPPLGPTVYAGQPVEFATGVTISNFSSGMPLIFNTRGGLDSADPATATLTYKSFNATFTIYPAIGQVRVQ